MPTLPNRLRQAAQYTGLDSMRELLIEAAGALEATPQPQERKRITDEQMEAVHEAARRSFIRHKSSIGGQQLTAADSLETHVMWATWAECCKTHGIKD